jgi:hypothetical protein
MAKGMTGLQKGIDENGDLVVMLATIDPVPQQIILVPVSNFDEFFASLNVKAPEDGVVEAQIIGKPTLIGRKGNHAAIAPPPSRSALEKYLKSTNNLASDKSLSTWVDANKLSIVVPSSGLKQLLPKLVSGIMMFQQQLGQAAGESGQAAVAAMKMYLDLFEAAETEVDQFALALRVDSEKTVSIVKRIQFSPGGDWANAVANIKPVSEDLLGGLPSKPFVLAFGNIVPQEALQKMMKFSVEMMQNQPMNKLTPEQAKKYTELSTQAMQGVRTMHMLIGIPEPGAGIYGSTTVVMTVDDSKQYIENYEKSVVEMRKLIDESKSAGIPTATANRIKVGDIDGLEITMKMPDYKQPSTPGGPDMEKMMKLFSGPEGSLKIFAAPADEHTVLMSYTSLERLKSLLDSYKSKEKGLSADPGVTKTAALLPQGSQVLGYISLSGAAKLAQQIAQMIAPDKPARIPDIAESPPIGMAGKISPEGIEGHLVITADTLRTIGDVTEKARQTRDKPPANEQ